MNLKEETSRYCIKDNCRFWNYHIAGIIPGGGVKFSWMLGFVVIHGKKVWLGQV